MIDNSEIVRPITHNFTKQYTFYTKMKDELNGIVVSHKPITEATLKRLLLIFDKIYFIKPEENRFLIPANVGKIKVENIEMSFGDYGVLYNGENYENQENLLLDKFDYGINKGIIKILDLNIRKFYEKNWLPLRLSYEFDAGNAELLNNYLPLISKNTDFTKQDGLIRGAGMSYGGTQIFPNSPPSVNFFGNEENKIYDFDHQIISMAGKVNRALAISYEFDLIPILINQNVANAYASKTEIAKENKDTKLNDLFFKINETNLEKVQFLLHKISEIILPDEIINNISVKELIYARENTYYECLKLRRKLIRSIYFLGNEKFDSEFIKEVNSYIKLEIEPLIGEYQTKFVENLNKFLKYTLPFGSGIAGSIIGINQSLSPMAIAYLSAISATVGTVTSDLSDYILKRSSKKFNNGFSYFTNLRE
jgi:hypothetical protein